MADHIIPVEAQVTYRQQFRRCGKGGCTRCGPGRPGHGPYWYAFWREQGRPRSRYLGKQAPIRASDGAEADAEAAPAAPAALAAPRPPLRVRTLGAFKAWRGEAAIPAAAWSSQRAAALFKCLLGAPGYRLQREQAIEALWPDVDPEAGATNLRTTVHRLRRILDGREAAPSYLRSLGDILALAPAGTTEAAEDWLDAAAFTWAATAALSGQDVTTCREALALYGGEYLPEDPYEPWAVAPRAALRRQYLALLLHLAALGGARGEVEEAEDCLRRVLAAEPSHEEAAATLMGLLAASGRRRAALQVYQALATALEEDLDVTPSAEVAVLRARLVAQEAAPVAANRPAARAQPARPTNLPVSLTSFVGRGQEVSAIQDVLRTGRLVTLMGPGGCGKTRLALEVADRLVDAAAYPDGVWLVELAALADPTLVPQVVAAALGVTEQAGQPVRDTLVAFLRPRHLLLLLDNCEHLRAACAELATTLLQACAHLRLLATSRARLAVAGARTYLVPSLAVPDPDHLPPLAQLPAYGAVQLFLERAQARRPTLTLTAANAGAVAAICARLDGLPLALELAAARASVLPVEGIAARLDDRFRLLTGGPRTALPRQQTLRATLAWSDDLLRAGEQALFRRLCIFVGGCTLEAAAAVCADGSGLEDDLLDRLGGLVDKSLLQREERTDGEPRFVLLETIRAYGLEQLAASGETEALREAHAHYYLALAEAALPEVTGPRQATWYARLEREHANLRAVLEWACAARRVELALRLARPLCWFWQYHSHLSEGRRWAERILALDPDPAGDAVLRAPVLWHAGLLAQMQGDDARATALYERNLAVCRELGDVDGIARSLVQLGEVARERGDPERAAGFYERALELVRSSGNAHGMGMCLSNLGDVARARGQDARAAALFEEAWGAFQSTGQAWGLGWVRHRQAALAEDRGHYARAVGLYREAVALFQSVGDRTLVAAGLEGVAASTAGLGAQGQVEQAARLLSAAAALRTAIGAPLKPFERARLEHVVATVRATLGAEAFGRAWAEGQHLHPEEAVADALEAT